MPFVPKKTKEKEKNSYKTLYISQKLIDEINSIAISNETSFNNVVFSMVDKCLDDDK